MGGTGAKERRRLKREATPVGTEKKLDVKNVSGRSNIDPNSSLPKPDPTRTSQNSVDIMKSRVNVTSVKKSQPEKSKKKVKKPKHLKRKLETLTDDAEKEAIRKTLETFERKKEQRSRAKKQKIEKRMGSKGTTQKSKDSGPAPDTSGLSTKDAQEQPEDFVSDDKMNRSVETIEKKQWKDMPEKPIIAHQQLDGHDGDDSDDSSTEEKDIMNERQRGKRRRGRKDTSKAVEEIAPTTASEPSKQAKPSKECKGEEMGVTEEATATDEKKRKKDPSRYCVGRKPVTDFIIWQSYPGKVLYIKPFGIFLDINSHSDAFCHVSRLRDDFVEDPTALFKEGDEVQARVVEIDRRKKRITVSLQSEAMISLERKSIESRKDRLDKRGKRSKSTEKKQKVSDVNKTAAGPIASNHSKSEIHVGPRHFVKLSEKDSGTKTHADLKRERKLARRAERRAEKEVGDTTSASQ